MTKPLALVLYERLMPGSQLVNRLQDLGYRTETLNDPKSLVEHAQKAKPMLVVADLEPASAKVSDALSHLKENSATSHLPIIAFCADISVDLPDTAKAATLVVTDSAIVSHLPLFLDRALQLD
jgi:DNA-binding NtrC family response regulator